MSALDWIIDIALIGVVYRQVTVHELSLSSMALPAVILVVAGINYFHGVSTKGNDLLLIAVLVLIGAVFGVVGGVATKVWRSPEGKILGRAGIVAAGAWIVGMGIRDGIDIWAHTASGGADLVRFSIRHSITSANIWSSALFLMAVGQVIVRIAILQGRRIRMEGKSGELSTAVQAT